MRSIRRHLRRQDGDGDCTTELMVAGDNTRHPISTVTGGEAPVTDANARAVIQRAKPSAPASVHLLLAAAMWTVVGSTLIVFGVRWVWLDSRVIPRVALAAALLAGIAKSRFVLDRAAHRIADRITARGDGRCIGGFLSPRTWVLVLIMAGTGRWLRAGHLSRPLVGLLYVAVGTALLLSSRVIWSRR